MPTNFNQTIKWYDEHADEYAAQIANSPAAELLERFISAVGPNAKVLDAGCAAGRDCVIFKDRGLTPVGIDLSHSLIELAQKDHPDIEFHQGSFLQLPFETQIFDGVWAHASLLHFETIDEVTKALKEFERVLKKGGVLHVFVKQQQGSEKTSAVTDAFSPNFERFFRWFTLGEVKELLVTTGFEIVSIEDNYTTPDGRREIKWIAALGKKI